MAVIYSMSCITVGFMIILFTVAVHCHNGVIKFKSFQRLDVSRISETGGLGLKLLGFTLCEITMNDCAWMCVEAIPYERCMAYTMDEEDMCYLYRYCRDSIMPPPPPTNHSIFGVMGKLLYTPLYNCFLNQFCINQWGNIPWNRFRIDSAFILTQKQFKMNHFWLNSSYSPLN